MESTMTLILIPLAFITLLAAFLSTLYASVVAVLEGDETAIPFAYLSGLGAYIIAYVALDLISIALTS